MMKWETIWTFSVWTKVWKIRHRTLQLVTRQYCIDNHENTAQVHLSSGNLNQVYLQN